MNKFLFSTIFAVVATTGSVHAAEQPLSTDPLANLSATAHAHLKEQIAKPEIFFNESIQAQALTTLAEESQKVLGKGLLVLNKNADQKAEALSRSE
ncbi:hypothetical protein CA267_002165 [Alteromonas pelagimontana]|uniref:Uncharacterized protein n=1 Tax=Alteromonas pelagimontana TaxID=1858656 RepID=A0A6M4MA42_9ALTE|nr:hypothetical protein [Alteromonas pelagimontana]QJR79688.1 hypothetical protein CA267_002165 [Alteromonas pelagimontana]